MKKNRFGLINGMLACAFALAFLAAPNAAAQDLGISAALWHFPEWFGTSSMAGDPGVFASIGAVLGLGPRLEAGASFIPRLSPEAFDDILAEAHLGLSLVGPRVSASGPVIYVNTLLDAGVFLGWHDVSSGSPTISRAAFLRLTPLTIGNPFYGRRDRLLSFGVARDFDSGAISLFANILSADIYLASGSGTH
jgi:hypothetical protein